MERGAFTEMLARQGFSEVVTVTRDAGMLKEHAHPFEAKALILHGEIRIETGEDEQWYRVGDVFHLAANEAHTEHYGPDGVQYLVGRK